MNRKEALLKAVEGLTYKPGWSFAVEDYMGLGLSDRIIALNIKVDTTCVDSGEPIEIDRSFVFGESAVLTGHWPEFFIVGCIEEIEEHETKEWIKFKGNRFYVTDHD